MYLFDANCAIGPWPTDHPAYETVDGLLVEMERLGIDRALVSHTLAQTHNAPQGNKLLGEQIAGYEQLFPCWTLLPLSCGEMGTLPHLLDDLAANNVRAVRFYPRDHSYPLTDWQCGDLLAALAERQYVVLLDFAQTSWGEIERLCRTYPDLALIVTRVSYRQFRPLFALLQRCANLYFDLANFSTYLGVEKVLAEFGSDCLLFGTGLPLADSGGPLARLFYTAAPEADIAAMAHGNLEYLLARVRLEGGEQ